VGRRFRLRLKVLPGVWLNVSRNRWVAAAKAGREYPTRQYEGDDPLGFVVSTNIRCERVQGAVAIGDGRARFLPTQGRKSVTPGGYALPRLTRLQIGTR